MKQLCWTLLVWALSSPFLFSQTGLDRPVTVTFENISPYRALLRIEASAQIPFSYNGNVLPTGPVSGSWMRRPLREILDDFLIPLGLKYVYEDGIVTIITGKPMPKRYAVSGYIEDASNGERLIGATVYDASTGRGTITNEFGFFNLRLPPDSVKLVVSMVGYEVYAHRFKLRKDIRGNILLKPNFSLDPVEINADDELMASEFGGASILSIPIEEVEKMPALMGESDVLSTLSLLPGVHSGPDGSGGLYVRGGGPDQNLVLYDGAPIYNSSHLFGFYSIFNSSAIKDIELVKGGFPARYGGRLSSVVNIRMKDGNLREWEGDGNVGLTSARLMLQGPVIKDRLSVVGAARRTLLEPYMLGINAISENQGGNRLDYYFYDLHGKVQWVASPRDRVFLTAYKGDDDFQTGYALSQNGINQDFDFRLGYGNDAAVLRWHRDWSPGVFSDFSLYSTRYQYNSLGNSSLDSLGLNPSTSQLISASGVHDLGARFQLDWLPANSQVIRMGGTFIQHSFHPEQLESRQMLSDSLPSTNISTQDTLRPLEGNLFFEDLILVNELLSFNVGLHAAFYLLDESFFSSLQPRVSFRVGPEDDWGITGSYTQMTQYQHLLTNSGLGPPVDLFVPATDSVPPQEAQQFSIGLEKTFEDLGFQVSVEGYYKELENLIDYDTNVNNIGEAGWQNLVQKNGNGTSYGIEAFIRKPKGKLRGFLGYTWSNTTRQFPTINNGEAFPYKYDLRHDFSASAILEVGKNMELSANWVYTSGINQTFLAIAYVSPGFTASPLDILNISGDPEVNLIFSDRNGFRLPGYHRLDLNFRRYKTRKWGETFLNIGVYNAYNRRNSYFRLIQPDYELGANSPRYVIRRLTLLPILPSINWGFKF